MAIYLSSYLTARKLYRPRNILQQMLDSAQLVLISSIHVNIPPLSSPIPADPRPPSPSSPKPPNPYYVLFASSH